VSESREAIPEAIQRELRAEADPHPTTFSALPRARHDREPALCHDRLHFPDLKREEYTPPVGPIQPRVDFGIPSLRLLIEAKFARTRSTLKETVNEIAQDNSNYFATPGPYDRLLVFVSDNAGHSEDHAQVREGMRKYDRVVDAVIVSRPGHVTDEAGKAC